MSTFILVQPLGPPPATTPAPISWPARKSVARNLFGSCPKGSVDEELTAQNDITNEYLEARYNFDLKKLDEKWNQQISATARATAKAHTQLLIDSDNVRYLNVQVEQKCANALSYARLEGIKGTFRVRKPHNGRSKKLKLKQSQNNTKTNNNKANNNNSSNHTE